MGNENGVSIFADAPAQPKAVIETASEAAAAGARAEIEAAYVIAYRKPRVMMEVRGSLLEECKRPGFAREAEYCKPVGGRKIIGLSIRAAEAALRTLGNVRTSVATIFENDMQQKVRISVTDLETNTTFSGEATIQKTVERRKPQDGAEVIGKRTNTTGQEVFIIKATDDDLQNKRNALISKELRNQALRVLPGDIREEMSVACRKTKADSAAKDPNTEKKAVLDSFSSVGVRPVDIVAWLRHDLDAVQPAELVELREMYQTIRDGESTWLAYIEARNEENDSKKGDQSKKPVPRGESAGKDKAATKKGAKKPKDAPPNEEPGRDPAEPSVQSQIEIGWDERELPIGKLISMLRADGVLSTFDSIQNLDNDQAAIVLENLGKYAEKLQG